MFKTFDICLMLYAKPGARSDELAREAVEFARECNHYQNSIFVVHNDRLARVDDETTVDDVLEAWDGKKD